MPDGRGNRGPGRSTATVATIQQEAVDLVGPGGADPSRVERDVNRGARVYEEGAVVVVAVPLS